MADFKVQRGTVTIGTGATTAVISAGVDYVAPSSATKAFIRIVSHGAFTNGDSVNDFSGQIGRNSAYVSNPSNILTSITFQRSNSTSTTATAIDWEIIEYIGASGGANEIVVRDVAALSHIPTATTITGTTGVANNDPADVVVFLTGVSLNSTERTASGGVSWTAEFDSTVDAAVLTRDMAPVETGNVSYAVVEFTGTNWSVQRITHNQSAVGAETETIATVDVSRAFTHVQQASNTDNGPRQLGYEVYLSGATQITFDVDVQAGTRRFVAWVVSNSDTGAGAMTVSRYSGTRAHNAGSAEPDIFTHSIAGVADVDQASIMGECANNGTSTTDDHYAMLGFRLTAADTVTMTRGRHINSRDYRFEVVQWPSASMAAAPTISSGTPTGTTTSTPTLGFTTDTNSGTARFVVDSAANLSGVTASQVLNGQKASGAAAAYQSNTITVSSMSVSGSLTASLPAGTYTVAAAQSSAGGNSNVLTWTITVPVTGPVIEGVSDTTPAVGSALVIDTTDTSASGNTVELTDGTDTITLTKTAESNTEITATVSNGSVFKYGVPLDLIVTDAASNASAPFELAELVPPAGHAAINIISLHPDPELRFTASPEFVPGCQVEHDQAGVFTLNGDGTWSVAPGASYPISVNWRIYSPAAGGDAQNWGAWETSTISLAGGSGSVPVLIRHLMMLQGIM